MSITKAARLGTVPVVPLAIGLSFCALFPAAARSQDLTALSLDQLLNIEVITASKFPQKVSEAPSSVTIITADDIKAYGYRTLADLLRSVRGVYVAYDRNYSYLGTRGSGRPGDFNSRVLVLVDGQRLNDAVYSQGSIGTEFPIDLELIDRVEYVPGPGSAIYGSSAFFGVLNLITRKARSSDGTEATIEASSHGTGKARLGAGRHFANGGDLLLGLSGFDSRGADPYFPEYDDAASNRGVAHRADYDRYKRVFAKYTMADLTLETYFGQRTKGIPTASYGQQFNEPRSRTVDQYFSSTVSYQHPLSATLDVFATLNFSQYRYAGTYVYSPDPANSNRDIGQSNVTTGELRFLSNAFRDHKLIYGIEVVDDTRRAMQNYDVAPYIPFLDVNHPDHRYGLYVQDEFRISDSLILNAGLRHDHDSEGGNATHPRLGLIFQATPELTTKFLYGTAYRSPSAYERYYVTDAASYKSVPGLRSENIKTYEFIAEYFPRQDFRGSVSLFHYKLENLISLVTDPKDGLLFYTNVDAASAKGIEIEAEQLAASGARMKGSVSLQSARNDGTGQWLTNSPRALVKLNASQPLFDNAARAGLEIQYTSRRKTILGGELGGFTVINLTLVSQKLGKNIDLSASAYNLLNKHYADPPSDEHFDNSSPPRFLQGIGQDGRSFRIGVTCRF